ncbi:hypothetical protein DICVIV_06992 [Dictyocaulus viviparus]|uniref:Uncharacterized protein n=1 Tax=Dictyocaulus viviparus TaxID=29172 RepID=A0A0D8XSX8_DICVI|nr:hypothetical protein DICVIV_06992 [Dictyocaulus viviparus]
MNCMRNNVPHFMTLLSNEQLKMIDRLVDSIHRYRRVDVLLQEIHLILLTAENGITSECAKRFNEVTVCPKCITDGKVGYCRSSCQIASFGCLENLAKNWEADTHKLEELTKNFHQGFDQVSLLITFLLFHRTNAILLNEGVSNSLRLLVEMKAPRLARMIVSRCGPLLRTDINETSYLIPKPQQPKEIGLNTEKLVKQLLSLGSIKSHQVN